MPSLTAPYKDDRRLVRRMIKGDEMAFEEFSNAYIPVLYRFARRRLTRDQDLVADLVQTTLCKVIPKLASYRGEAALVTWLCTCLRNEINGYFRKTQRRPQDVAVADDYEIPSEAALQPVLSENPERELLDSEHSRLVHEVLDALPPRYGRALEWKYIDRFSVNEIASRLDLSPKAAESLLTRARVAFRERYSSLSAKQRAESDAA